jgi:hypothetical protein
MHFDQLNQRELVGPAGRRGCGDAGCRKRAASNAVDRRFAHPITPMAMTAGCALFAEASGKTDMPKGKNVAIEYRSQRYSLVHFSQ